ncbi:MAG: thiaminase II [Chloroflexota bacterium]|nr:thiaminase II [Chloroflexota bacterium]
MSTPGRTPDRATTSTSARLRVLADPIWQAQLDHPLVRGIGDGTLDPARFAAWLRQDYLFLREYGRVLAYAAARAPDPATMARFSTLLHETLSTEMDLHRSYVAGFGITVADLDAETMLPTTRAYTDFLVRSAATADVAESYAALLPCMWGYSWLGQELARGGLPGDERYARWVATYADPAFADLATWCRDLLDGVADDLTGAARTRVDAAFLLSSRYELAFWEMAWRGETWPGPPIGDSAP